MNRTRVRCHCNWVQYNMIFYISQEWLRQIVNQNLNTHKTPHISPYRASYGVSFMRILDKIDHVVIAQHCSIIHGILDSNHDGVIKWKHFPHYWPFERGIHQSLVNFHHKDQWCRALMFSLVCAWTNGWVNNQDTGYLRYHGTHYDVTVMIPLQSGSVQTYLWGSELLW